MDYNKNDINDITADFTQDLIALNTLRELKAKLEADGIDTSVKHQIDTLVLTSFDNVELNKLKSEILETYNKMEKESRSFFGFLYATIDDKLIAQAEYNEISKMRTKAQNAGYDILLRKNILNQMHNMSYHMKNAAPLLYEIDIACRTLNGSTYNSMSDLENALKELSLVDEFIKIDEILDNTKDITAIINIKSKVKDIKKHSYSNSDINERLKSINKKLENLEYELKFFNGRRYSSLEDVKVAQDELYYIEIESHKFDLLTRDGLKFFLELMSLKEFKSIDAKNLIEKYRNEFISLNNKEILKVTQEEKLLVRKKRKRTLKIIGALQIITFIGFIASFFSSSWFIITGASIIVGTCAVSLIFYSIYYGFSKIVDFFQDKFESKFKPKKY